MFLNNSVIFLNILLSFVKLLITLYELKKICGKYNLYYNNVIQSDFCL